MPPDIGLNRHIQAPSCCGVEKGPAGDVEEHAGFGGCRSVMREDGQREHCANLKEDGETRRAVQIAASASEISQPQNKRTAEHPDEAELDEPWYFVSGWSCLRPWPSDLE